MQILFYLLFLFIPVQCFVPTDNFFPYNTANDQKMPKSDDGSSLPQNLSKPFPFFDKLFPQVWVNVNGAISFHSPISTFTPICNNTASLNYSMISPFWADIDTRFPVYGDAVYFRESFAESDLSQAESEVINAFPNLYGIKFKFVFIATWFNVTFFKAEDHPYEKRNTFQSAIATDGIHSFAIFYYNKITWTTGDYSNGVHGFGGKPARAGFDAGDGKNRLMLDGSCKPEILTIVNRSNVNFPGKWIFRVDSANIETAGCTGSFLTSDTLKLSPTFVTTLGQVAVEVSGPCLSTTNTTTVTCRIYDPSQLPYISVKGKIVGSRDSIKVICGIPYLFSIGRMKLELAILDDSAPISFLNTTYHGFLYVTDLNPSEGNNLKLEVSKDSNGTAENTTFTWNPKSFVNGTNFINLQLITFFQLTKKPQMQSVIKIGDKIVNNGKWIWNHKMDSNNAMFVTQLCNSFGVKVVFQAIEFGWDMMGGNDYRSHWIANSEVDGNKFLGDFCDSLIREKLCIDWYLSADNTSSSTSHSCPPTAEKASSDLRFIPRTTQETSFYHSGNEDICYQSIAPFENGEGQECCYKNGNIDCDINGGFSQSSHPNNPFSHYSNDILPWIMCCYKQNEGICGRYRDKRTCDPGINYISPGPALGIGDPHFHTFDNLFYTFNGYGEFWILENSTSQPLAVQARMEPLNPEIENTTTIFSGFVFVAPNSAKIQIQKSLIRIVDIFIDDQQLHITSPNSLKTFSLNGWQLNIADDYSEIQIGTNLGFSFKITTSNHAFGILVTAAPEWKSKTLGLLGNFNGNKSDDLTSKNGTVLDPNSSLQQIHESFGLTWAVTSETSLFTYFGGKSFADFNNLNFMPTFTFNTSAVSHSVQDICKNDWSCLFDGFYANLALANFTLLSNQNYENTVTILNEKIQMCPALISPENGYLKVSNYFVGSKANFGCFTNYTVNRNISFTCENNFQWNPTNWNEIICNYNFAQNSSPLMMKFDFIVLCLALILNTFVWF